MKFRKRPVVVDAIRYEPLGYSKVLDFLLDGHKDYSHLPMCRLDGKHGVSLGVSDGVLRIPTLEGIMLCRLGDWVVKGTKGEFYPVKAEIFDEIYEPVEAEVTA